MGQQFGEGADRPVAFAHRRRVVIPRLCALGARTLFWLRTVAGIAMAAGAILEERANGAAMGKVPIGRSPSQTLIGGATMRTQAPSLNRVPRGQQFGKVPIGRSPLQMLTGGVTGGWTGGILLGGSARGGSAQARPFQLVPGGQAQTPSSVRTMPLLHSGFSRGGVGQELPPPPYGTRNGRSPARRRFWAPCPS